MVGEVVVGSRKERLTLTLTGRQKQQKVKTSRPLPLFYCRFSLSLSLLQKWKKEGLGVIWGGGSQTERSACGVVVVYLGLRGFDSFLAYLLYPVKQW